MEFKPRKAGHWRPDTNNRPFRGLLQAFQPLSIVVALAVSGDKTFGAMAAFDTASNYALGTWSETPPNLGSGFGNWSSSATPPQADIGTFLDTSSSVVSNGYSWGEYLHESLSAASASFTLTRRFAEGPSTRSSSLFNQTLGFDLSSGPTNQPGVDVHFGGNLEFYYAAAQGDNFRFWNGNSSVVATGVTSNALRAGINVSLSVSSEILNSSIENYTFTVTSLTGGTPLFTQSGVRDDSTAAISYISIGANSTAGDVFFNNLSISPELPALPEPSTLVWGIGAIGITAFSRLRRKHEARVFRSKA